MKTILEVQNIMCGGCCHTIRKELLAVEGVEKVDIDIDNGIVTIEHASETPVDGLKRSLYKMGYPETGTAHGLAALKTTAVSFVSCAIGRLK